VEIVTAEPRWLYEGYVAACARFQAIEDAHKGAEEAFSPLFEALNWAVTFEDLMRKRGEPLEDEVVSAFRYARNRVHHQWAAALMGVGLRRRPVPLAPGPEEESLAAAVARHPEAFGLEPRWVWVSLDRLPQVPPRWPPR
jgi:hypothetical protein